MPDFNFVFQFITKLKEFFVKKGFTEVIVPVMVSNPGIDVHVNSFKVENTNYYLPSSPEFALKYLLSVMRKDIFNISYSFRNEPVTDLHRPQFIMLEWYRYNKEYYQIMEDVKDLLGLFGETTVIRKTVAEVFKEFADVDILNYLKLSDLDKLVKDRFPDIYVANLNWDDLFFLLFLNKIEPSLKKYRCLILDEYPYHLSSLAKIKGNICERFELYIDGIEVANCFNELNDVNEQKSRIENDLMRKKELYDIKLEEPKVLIDALNRGIGNSSGIAMGVDRLIKVIHNKDSFWPVELY